MHLVSQVECGVEGRECGGSHEKLKNRSYAYSVHLTEWPNSRSLMRNIKTVDHQQEGGNNEHLA